MQSARLSVPVPAHGKLDRGSLPARHARFAPGGVRCAAAGVGGIWAEVLGRPGWGENFFDLGGHSLLLAKVQRVSARR
jgi:hypothetical protein